MDARRVLVTGGAGFIGSNYVHLFANKYEHDELICLDALTYAGNRENLAGLDGSGHFQFVHGDIRDAECVRRVMEGVTHVVHFAAESHVDRAILGGDEFLTTNVLGTRVLLEAARDAGVRKFVQVGTDEVYGALEAPAEADESAPLRPRNPYSSSKAAADLLALSYHATYDLPVCVTRSGNNYGAYQFPEKLLPLAILRALADRPIPVYGDGLNIRDWIHVRDHCRALDLVLERGEPGRVYNIAAEGGRTNLEILQALLALLQKPESLLEFVADRPGHDRRYAVDWTRAREELGFKPTIEFETGLRQTVDWYRNRESWWRPLLERMAAERAERKTHWLEE